MRSLFARKGRLLTPLAGLLTLSLLAPAAGAQEFKSYWKFSLNLGFNEARSTCRSFEHPRQSGVWVGGNGSCQGAWSDLYTQTYLRSPELGAAWVRLDANLFLTFDGERRPQAGGAKVGNSQLFIEAGNVIGRDALIWAGKRYYKQEYLWVINMNIVTEDAPGFGIYNIDFGEGGKLAAAVFRSLSNQEGPLQTSIDTRLEDISLGRGRLHLIHVFSETGRADARSGESRYAPLQGNKLAAIYRLWNPDSSHETAMVLGQGLFGGTDSEEYEQGTLIDSSGAWRNYTVFAEGADPETRRALLKSATVRAGYQFSYYPSGGDWSHNFALGFQKVSFGGLRFQEAERYYERADMDTYAGVLRTAYHFSSTFALEPSFAYLRVFNGLGYKHREASGSIQESLRPVDQRLSNVSLSFNLRPVGRWQQNFSLYVGQSFWNQEIRRDISQGRFPQRSSGFYAGISSYFEI